MDAKTLQIHRSIKPTKPIEDVVGERRYIIPIQKANERDPATMKPSVIVISGGKTMYLPVGEQITIAQDIFSILCDAGVLSPMEGGFDPLYDVG